MKPGYGKPHKDCAVRCILFYVRNEKGDANYYLVLDRHGKKLNDILKDYFGDPFSSEAKAVQYDDWIVVYVDGKDKISRTGGLSWFKTRDGDVTCGAPHNN